MKIAVCGSGEIFEERVAAQSRNIGKEISLQNHILLTGGCCGYPEEAAKGAFHSGGEVIAYSPAKDEKEHIAKYGFPVDSFSEIVFTGKGIPERNVDLVRAADAVLIIDGKAGTLNEFTVAFHLGKKMGVLIGSGGISDKIREIAKIIDKNGEKERIVYEEEAKKLVSSLHL